MCKLFSIDCKKILKTFFIIMLNWSKVKTLNKWVRKMQADDTPLGDTTMKIIFIAIVLVVILTLPLD
ncbi:hypothetical protein BB394_08135 [Helicobacter pylori]|nr:hypothetical protein BGL82_01945 [Helicobacter pylori]PDW92349.1 hypothetical protein BB394_08135 [Helicobacter pylori]